MNKISMFEIAALSITVVISTSIMFTPYFAAQAAGQGAWISVLAAGLIACIPTAAAVAVMAKFPRQSVIQAMPQLLGVFLGKIVSLLYACFFLFFAALAVWRMEAFAIRFLIPDTPQLVIRMIFLLGVAYGAFSGSTPLLRTNAYVMPLEILVPILTVILPAARLNLNFLLPLFEQGVKPVINGTVLLLGWFCQAPVVILMFQRHVSDALLQGGGRKAVMGTLVATVTMGLGIIGILAAFGPEQTSTMFYPAFALVRIISVSTFLEHTEVIFVVVWVASIFLATTFYIQAFAESISDILNLKGKSAKIWIMLISILILTVWPLFFNFSFYVLISTIRDIGAAAGAAFGGVIPLLLLVRVIIAPPKQKQKKAIPQPELRSSETEGGVFGSEIEDGGEQKS
ncbi:MAG: endospore germination permease [Eubacteriales bacterium]|nr:endospore germination permease [Eubacteriales bacterium]